MSEKSRLENLCREAKRYMIKTKPPVGEHDRLCLSCEAVSLVVPVELIQFGGSRYIEMCGVCLSRLIESRKSPFQKACDKIEKSMQEIKRIIEDDDPEDASYQDWIKSELGEIEEVLEELGHELEGRK